MDAQQILTYSNDIFIFNTQSRVISTMPSSIVEARIHHALATTTGSLYVIGGTSQNGLDLSSVWEYHLTNRHWTRLADMPNPRSGMIVTVGDREETLIISQGGTKSTIYREDFVYTIATDSWKKASPSLIAFPNTISATSNNGSLAFISNPFDNEEGVGISYKYSKIPDTYALSNYELPFTYEGLHLMTSIGSNQYFLSTIDTPSFSLDLTNGGVKRVNFRVTNLTSTHSNLTSNGLMIYLITTDSLGVSSLVGYDTVLDTTTTIPVTLPVGVDSSSNIIGTNQGLSIFSTTKTTPYVTTMDNLDLTTLTFSASVSTPFIGAEVTSTYDSPLDTIYLIGQTNQTNLSLVEYPISSATFVPIGGLPNQTLPYTKMPSLRKSGIILLALNYENVTSNKYIPVTSHNITSGNQAETQARPPLLSGSQISEIHNGSIYYLPSNPTKKKVLTQYLYTI